MTIHCSKRNVKVFCNSALSPTSDYPIIPPLKKLDNSTDPLALDISMWNKTINFEKKQNDYFDTLSHWRLMNWKSENESVYLLLTGTRI